MRFAKMGKRGRAITRRKPILQLEDSKKSGGPRLGSVGSAVDYGLTHRTESGTLSGSNTIVQSNTEESGSTGAKMTDEQMDSQMATFLKEISALATEEEDSTANGQTSQQDAESSESSQDENKAMEQGQPVSNPSDQSQPRGKNGGIPSGQVGTESATEKMEEGSDVITFWQEVVDPDTNHAYYWNPSTGEVSWTLPDNGVITDEVKQPGNTATSASDASLETTYADYYAYYAQTYYGVNPRQQGQQTEGGTQQPADGSRKAQTTDVGISQSKQPNASVSSTKEAKTAPKTTKANEATQKSDPKSAVTERKAPVMPPEPVLDPSHTQFVGPTLPPSTAGLSVDDRTSVSGKLHLNPVPKLDPMTEKETEDSAGIPLAGEQAGTQRQARVGQKRKVDETEEDKEPVSSSATPTARGSKKPRLQVRSPQEKSPKRKTLVSPAAPLSKQAEQALRLQVSMLSDEFARKLHYLHISTEGITDLQLLDIQLQTRLSDWKEGGLSSKFMLGKLKQASQDLQQYENQAAPDGWKCVWDSASCRYHFHNLTTGESTWEYPIQAVLSPSSVEPPSSELSSQEEGEGETETTDHTDQDTAEEEGERMEVETKEPLSSQVEEDEEVSEETGAPDHPEPEPFIGPPPPPEWMAVRPRSTARQTQPSAVPPPAPKVAPPSPSFPPTRSPTSTFPPVQVTPLQEYQGPTAEYLHSQMTPTTLATPGRSKFQHLPGPPHPIRIQSQNPTAGEPGGAEEKEPTVEEVREKLQRRRRPLVAYEHKKEEKDEEEEEEEESFGEDEEGTAVEESQVGLVFISEFPPREPSPPPHSLRPPLIKPPQPPPPTHIPQQPQQVSKPQGVTVALKETEFKEAKMPEGRPMEAEVYEQHPEKRGKAQERIAVETCARPFLLPAMGPTGGLVEAKKAETMHENVAKKELLQPTITTTTMEMQQPTLVNIPEPEAAESSPTEMRMSNLGSPPPEQLPTGQTVYGQDPRVARKQQLQLLIQQLTGAASERQNQAEEDRKDVEGETENAAEAEARLRQRLLKRAKFRFREASDKSGTAEEQPSGHARENESENQLKSEMQTEVDREDISESPSPVEVSISEPSSREEIEESTGIPEHKSEEGSFPAHELGIPLQHLSPIVSPERISVEPETGEKESVQVDYGEGPGTPVRDERELERSMEVSAAVPRKEQSLQGGEKEEGEILSTSPTPEVPHPLTTGRCYMDMEKGKGKRELYTTERHYASDHSDYSDHSREEHRTSLRHSKKHRSYSSSPSRDSKRKSKHHRYYDDYSDYSDYYHYSDEEYRGRRYSDEEYEHESRSARKSQRSQKHYYDDYSDNSDYSDGYYRDDHKSSHSHRSGRRHHTDYNDYSDNDDHHHKDYSRDRSRKSQKHHSREKGRDRDYSDREELRKSRKHRSRSPSKDSNSREHKDRDREGKSKKKKKERKEKKKKRSHREGGSGDEAKDTPSKPPPNVLVGKVGKVGSVRQLGQKKVPTEEPAKLSDAASAEAAEESKKVGAPSELPQQQIQPPTVPPLDSTSYYQQPNMDQVSYYSQAYPGYQSSMYAYQTQPAWQWGDQQYGSYAQSAEIPYGTNYAHGGEAVYPMEYSQGNEAYQTQESDAQQVETAQSMEASAADQHSQVPQTFEMEEQQISECEMEIDSPTAEESTIAQEQQESQTEAASIQTEGIESQHPVEPASDQKAHEPVAVRSQIGISGATGQEEQPAESKTTTDSELATNGSIPPAPPISGDIANPDGTGLESPFPPEPVESETTQSSETSQITQTSETDEADQTSFTGEAPQPPVTESAPLPPPSAPPPVPPPPTVVEDVEGEATPVLGEETSAAIASTQIEGEPTKPQESTPPPPGTEEESTKVTVTATTPPPPGVEDFTMEVPVTEDAYKILSDDETKTAKPTQPMQPTSQEPTPESQSESIQSMEQPSSQEAAAVSIPAPQDVSQTEGTAYSYGDTQATDPSFYQVSSVPTTQASYDYGAYAQSTTTGAPQQYNYSAYAQTGYDYTQAYTAYMQQSAAAYGYTLASDGQYYPNYAYGGYASPYPGYYGGMYSSAPYQMPPQQVTSPVTTTPIPQMAIQQMAAQQMAAQQMASLDSKKGKKSEFALPGNKEKQMKTMMDKWNAFKDTS